MIDTVRRTPELDAFLTGLPGDQQLVMRRYEDLIERGGPDAGLVHMIEASLRAPDNSAMPEAEKAAAFARLFTTIQAATHESLDQVQVHADRLWGRLSNDEKRQIALNPSAAATIAIDAMRNDPMLAARINPASANTPRGIEAYQGGAAFGFMGGHFAALREQDSARSAEARQFADLGVSRADAATLSAVGMDRAMFDRYLRDGFTQAQILSGARDANTLGFKGREDMDIAMHAPSDLRAAAAAVAKAKTDAEREAALKHYEELKRKYEALPDSDPRKHDAHKFDDRFQQVNGVFLNQAAQLGGASREVAQDKKVAANIASIGKKAYDETQTALVAESTARAATMSQEQQLDVTVAAFGFDAAPVQQADVVGADKPAIKVADAAANKPDTKAVTGETKVGDAATPDPAAKVKVANAPVKLPSAAV